MRRFFFFSSGAHVRNLARDASIQYRCGADGVLWALGMCQYCRRAKSPAPASVEISSWFWYVTLTIILSLYFFNSFFDGTVAALTTACGKFFSTRLSREMLQVQTQLASLQMCLFIYPLLSAAAFGFGCARVPNEPSVSVR